jgi:alpha/beta hydrolase family protein
MSATVTSRDGTTIAYETTGTGPPLILVDGALCYRDFGPSRKLAEQLAGDFTVITYDRRGRGESGDGLTYAVEREVEDLEALIEAAGGSAHVYGISSGAALALDAAQRDIGVERLALYEAPFIVDDGRAPIDPDYVSRLNGFLVAGRPGDAVRLFMRHLDAPRDAGAGGRVARCPVRDARGPEPHGEAKGARPGAGGVLRGRGRGAARSASARRAGGSRSRRAGS